MACNRASAVRGEPRDVSHPRRHERGDSLEVIRNRRNDIACVLVNPLQALHPNA